MVCTGNDWVISILINDQEVKAYFSHERLFKKQQQLFLARTEVNWRVDQFGTRILSTEAPQEFSDSDIIIDNLVTAFYEACSKEEKTVHDRFILRVFKLKMQEIVDEINEREQLKNQLMHYVLVVPQSWETIYFPTIQEEFQMCGFRSLFDLQHTFKTIHYSDTVIRYFMEPMKKPILKSGKNYIVYHFTNDATDIYGYEIGKPIRGVKHMFQYDLVMYQSVFAFTTEGFKDQIRNFLACNDEIEDIISYFADAIYWDEYDENAYLLDILLEKNVSQDTINKLKLKKVKDTMNYLLEQLTAPMEAHCAKYHDTQVMILMDREYNFIQLLKERLGADLIQKDSHTGAYVYDLGALRTSQIDLMQSNHIPRIVPNEQYECFNMNTFNKYRVHIDIQWDKNSAVCHTVDNHQITYTKHIDMRALSTVNQSFIFYKPIHGSNIRNIDITPIYKQKIKLTNSQSIRKKFTKSVSKRSWLKKAKEILHTDEKFVWQEILDSKQVVNDIYENIRLKIPHIKRLFRMYIKRVQSHVQQSLESSGYDISECQYILTIDQTILDAFLVKYRVLRKSLREYYRKRGIVMKVVHREHISAVYCKEQLKYYESVEDQYDYPKEIAQAHMRSDYITVTYIAILSLTKDPSSSNDETTIITDKVLIPFNMMDVMIEYMWKDIVSSDANNITLCDQHTGYEYASIDGIYSEYTGCFYSYLIHNYLCSKNDINWYENINIPLRTKCKCILNTSRRDIFDICIIPAIDQLFHVIISSLYVAFIFKEYNIDDLLLMGTPVISIKDSPMSMEIMKTMKDKFTYNQKYHKAKITWIDKDMDTIINSAVESIVTHPESGLCEQVLREKYTFKMQPFSCYFDFKRTEMITPGDHYLLDDEWETSSCSVFAKHENTLIYPDANYPNLSSWMYIYIELEGSSHLLFCGYYKIPSNGFPCVLKKVATLGFLLFSFEKYRVDFVPTPHNCCYRLYEPITLHII